METLNEVIWVLIRSADDARLTALELTVETCTYHEMLHVCGDLEHDGVLRHNLAGFMPIVELIEGAAG